MRTFFNKIAHSVFFLTIAAMSTVMAPLSAEAGVSDWIKGCVIMGGTGIGGTVLAASMSKVELKDNQAYILAGATGCIVGGFMAGDIVKKAEMRASEKLRLENARLKSRLYNVAHDLCYVKGTCGPDGRPRKQKEKQIFDDVSAEDYESLDSGN